MRQAIEIVRRHLLEADRHYDSKNAELYRACREGTITEQRKLKKEEKALWEKRQVFANLLVELNKDTNRNDQDDFMALLAVIGGKK